MQVRLLPKGSLVLVCHCHRVSDTRIDRVLDAGARTVREVVRATHAGTGCGGCLPQLREMCARASLERACLTQEAIAG